MTPSFFELISIQNAQIFPEELPHKGKRQKGKGGKSSESP